MMLSSHLTSEMMQTADHLIAIGRGTILADGPMRDVIAGATSTVIRVRTREVQRLVDAVSGPDMTVTTEPHGAVEVAGLTAEQVAEKAAAAGVVLFELTPIEGSLEDAYLSLTADAAEYRATPAAPKGAPR